jgi:type II secretory pathway pseudopilin PulG
MRQWTLTGREVFLMKRRTIIIITVAIVTIFAVLAILSYFKLQQGAKHSEVMTNLTCIKLSIEGYYLATGRYPDNLDVLDLGSLQESKSRFNYSIKLTSPNSYEVIATDKESGKLYTLIGGAGSIQK